MSRKPCLAAHQTEESGGTVGKVIFPYQLAVQMVKIATSTRSGLHTEDMGGGIGDKVVNIEAHPDSHALGPACNR